MLLACQSKVVNDNGRYRQFVADCVGSVLSGVAMDPILMERFLLGPYNVVLTQISVENDRLTWGSQDQHSGMVEGQTIMRHSTHKFLIYCA